MSRAAKKMVTSAYRALRTTNKRQAQIWLLAFAALVSSLGLATHLVSSFNQDLANLGLFSGRVYSVELILVCLSTLLLLKLATDEYRDSKRKQADTLREGIIREHQGVLKGQAKALDAHAMVSVSSPTGQLLDANDNFRTFFGYGESDIHNAQNMDLYPGGRENHTHQAIAKAVREGKTWQGKQSLRKLNGEPVTVFATVIPVMDESGQRTHSICIRTDITELDNSERQRMLTQLMGDLQEEVYVYEVDTLAMIYANKAAFTRCNWSPEDLTKLTISDSSKNFDTALFRQHTKPLFDDSEETVTINTMHEKGPVEITTRLVLTQAGKQVFVSVLRDTSEQHRIEKARLESLSEASHELRSPLTSIKGSLKILEAGLIGPLPEKAAELVSVAHRNTDRLIGMVNNVLDFEKLKSGTMEIETCPIDLNDVVRKSVEMMEGYSNQHKVDIALELPDQPTLVRGNADRLSQVIVNLISNATKYSPENGSITVTIAGQGGRYRVSVKDEGPGVPEDAKDVIFESFGQVDALDGVKRHGTGLGLAISQRILKMHDTKMELASMQGQGSDFYFDIPKLETMH